MEGEREKLWEGLPFGSVVLVDFSTIPYLGNHDLFTNSRSLFPSRLATVLSSGIKMLMSLTSNAYSFGFSFRFLHTASSTSCMYIPAVLEANDRKPMV